MLYRNEEKLNKIENWSEFKSEKAKKDEPVLKKIEEDLKLANSGGPMLINLSSDK
jgi:hypothetical protein